MERGATGIIIAFLSDIALAELVDDDLKIPSDSRYFNPKVGDFRGGTSESLTFHPFKGNMLLCDKEIGHTP